MSEEITLLARRWWRPFGRPTPVAYSGQGTVWHEVATGQRAPTRIDQQLSEISWKRACDKTRGQP